MFEIVRYDDGQNAHRNPQEGAEWVLVESVRLCSHSTLLLGGNLLRLKSWLTSIEARPQPVAIKVNAQTAISTAVLIDVTIRVLFTFKCLSSVSP